MTPFVSWLARLRRFASWAVPVPARTPAFWLVCLMLAGLAGAASRSVRTWEQGASGSQVSAPASAPIRQPVQTAVAASESVMAAPGAPRASGTAAARKPPIFVLNSLDANVSVIDPVSFEELQRLPTGKEPHHLYLTPDEKSLLVANALSDSITLLDPRTGLVQKVITNVADPYHLRFSPDMKWLVTAANRLDHVDIYRVVMKPVGGLSLVLVKRIATAKTPSHITIDARSTVAYISMQDSDELIAIDLLTQKPRWKIPVGKMPADVMLTPDDRTLLVALTGDKYVEAYDVSGAKPVLTQRVETGEGAHAFRAWGDGRHALVSNRVANTISRLDLQTMKVVASYNAPGGPDCMDLTADGKIILVTSRWARKLTFIDTVTGQVTRQVPVGRSPHGVWTLDHAPR